MVFWRPFPTSQIVDVYLLKSVNKGNFRNREMWTIWPCANEGKPSELVQDPWGNPRVPSRQALTWGLMRKIPRSLCSAGALCELSGTFRKTADLKLAAGPRQPPGLECPLLGTPAAPGKPPAPTGPFLTAHISSECPPSLVWLLMGHPLTQTLPSAGGACPFSCFVVRWTAVKTARKIPRPSRELHTFSAWVHPEVIYSSHPFIVVVVWWLSHVWLFASPLDCAPPGSSVCGFSEYWSGLPFPPPRDLPDPEIEPASPALAGGFSTAEPPGEPSSDPVPPFYRGCVLLQGTWHAGSQSLRDPL